MVFKMSGRTQYYSPSAGAAKIVIVLLLGKYCSCSSYQQHQVAKALNQKSSPSSTVSEE